MQFENPGGASVLANRTFVECADKPALLDQKITSLHLLGSKEKIAWSQDDGGLRVTLPATKPCDDVFGLKLALS